MIFCLSLYLSFSHTLSYFVYSIQFNCFCISIYYIGIYIKRKKKQSHKALWREGAKKKSLYMSSFITLYRVKCVVIMCIFCVCDGLLSREYVIYLMTVVLQSTQCIQFVIYIYIYSAI